MESLCKIRSKTTENDQKRKGMWVCQDIVECLQTESDLLCRVIARDETLTFEYDLETKCIEQLVEVSNIDAAEKSQKRKACWFNSSIWGALSTASPCYRTRWSISKSTRRSYSVCFVQHMRRDESCGRTNSWQCTNSQCPEHLAVPGNEEYHCSGTTSLFPWSCSTWLFLFSKLKGIIKRTHFEGMEFFKRAIITME